MINKRRLITILALLVLILAATPALAHIERGQAAGFFTGLYHPVSGMDHVLAMVAVGLWGAQLGANGVLVTPPFVVDSTNTYHSHPAASAPLVRLPISSAPVREGGACMRRRLCPGYKNPFTIGIYVMSVDQT